MTAYALDAQGAPLGVLEQQRWVRPEQPHPVPHEKRALHEKESRWWTELMQRCRQVFAGLPTRPKLWFQCDREADQVSVLQLACEIDEYVTVRVDDNRLLACGYQAQNKSKGHRAKLKHVKLKDTIDAMKGLGLAQIAMPKSGPRKACRVQAQVSHGTVTVRLRTQPNKKFVADVTLHVVHVCSVETNAKGQAVLEWLLYTTYPVYNFQQVLTVIRNYAYRWRIEQWHFTTKSGYGPIPQSQLGSLQALEKLVIVQGRVAAHYQALLHRARTEPEVSALEEFSASEVEAVERLVRRYGIRVEHSPGQVPTLRPMVYYAARIGGCTGTRSDAKSPPGIVTFMRGMHEISLVAQTLSLARSVGAFS